MFFRFGTRAAFLIASIAIDLILGCATLRFSNQRRLFPALLHQSVKWQALRLTLAMASQASDKPDALSADGQHKPPLLLTDAPADEPIAANGPTTLSVDGGSIALDHLGPMVINTDGTISRISNWDKLTEPERARTLRLVAQRNAVRVQKRKEIEENASSERSGQSSGDGSNQPARNEL